MDKLIKREEVKKSDKWDIESVYNTLDKYNKDYDIVKSNIIKLSKMQDTFLDNSKNFKEFLLLDSDTSRLIAKLYTYAARKYDEDTGNSTYQELYGKINNLYQEYGEATSFVVPMILEKDKDTILNTEGKYDKGILGVASFTNEVTIPNWEIIKRSSSSDTLPLGGAEFTLTKKDGNVPSYYGKSSDNNEDKGKLLWYSDDSYEQEAELEKLEKIKT